MPENRLFRKGAAAGFAFDAQNHTALPVQRPIDDAKSRLAWNYGGSTKDVPGIPRRRHPDRSE
jgi:hypothetical protein